MEMGIPTGHIIYCENCSKKSSAKQIRQHAGLCRKCGSTTWQINARWYKEDVDIAGSVAGLGLLALTGTGWVSSSTETEEIEFSGVTPDELYSICENSEGMEERLTEFLNHRIFLQEETSRKLKDAEMLQRGAKYCTHCGTLALVLKYTPWTAYGYCSAACYRADNPDEEYPWENPELSASVKKEPEIKQFSATCLCGHSFDVPAMYVGTMRRCPECQAKVAT